MTARTCPVHGEYSATGVCRWCEKPSGADQSTITLPLLCICKTCLRGFEAPIPLTSLECPECRAKSGESAVAKAVSDYFKTRAGMAPLFLTRQRYSTPEGIASHNAFWDAKLATQHAALRWERVARRWNWKHREPRWINEEWRAYVWRCWLEQMALRRAGNLIAAGIPKGCP